MDYTILETFPRNKIEALTMLYIQRKDISDMSPSDLLDMYDDIYDQIVKYANEKEIRNTPMF